MQSHLGTRIAQQDAQLEDLKRLGLESTPEMLEFVNQLAEAASANAPLAQPYIEAGAIKIYQKEVFPGVTFQAVGFHHTKLAEMLKAPASHFD